MENGWQILESLATAGAALFAGLALWQARVLLAKQRQFAQRQLFIPLFEQFKGIAEIDPENPIWPDVINVVNFLDLLGICYEGELVDRSTLLRVFREFIVENYERVQQCKNPPQNVSRDGAEMLKNSRAATSLYNLLVNEDLGRDRPLPLS